MVKVRFILFLIVTGLLFSACSKQTSTKDYKLEAAAVCEVFNPNNWVDLPYDTQLSDIEVLLKKRLNDAIKTDEMREIMETLPKVKPGLRYQYYKKSVSELVAESHECPAIESYY